MLEDTTRVNLLYDFYGNLLTERQRDLLELYYQHDLSLSEVADESGISRQGVHDMLKRAVRTLERAEERLGLVARFKEQQAALRNIKELLSRQKEQSHDLQAALILLDKLID